MTKNQEIKFIIIIIAVMLTTVSQARAETIIVNGSQEIEYLQNLTNTTTINETEISQAQYSELLESIGELVAVTKLLEQEKKFLESIQERDIVKNEQLKTALNETTQVNKQLADQLFSTQRENRRLNQVNTEDITRLNNQITLMNSKLEREKIMRYVYSTGAVFLTMILYSFIAAITKRGKWYFIWRRIRKRIPINI